MGRFPIANKQLGQHFLHSQHVITKITSPLPENTDCIFEIGPGPAVLSPLLKNYNTPFYVIEMDERFVSILEPVLGAENIFRQDALTFNWEHFLSDKKYHSIWLVSNLPYNISVPLTLSFLKIPAIKHMTLMYQKEVAEKILPKNQNNSMNSLHALCFSQFEIKHNVYAPPGAFSPPPKVDSQVLNFHRRNNPLIDLNLLNQFEQFLRLSFSQKRKQLFGLLKNQYGSEKATLIMNSAQINLNIRAESLTFDQIVRLFNHSLI